MERSTTMTDFPDHGSIPAKEFDLEDLSQVIEARGKIAQAKDVAAREHDEDSESITLQIEIEPDLDVCEPDVEIYDALLGASKPAFRSEHGLYLRHRVAVLGVGGAVQGVYQALRHELGRLRHELITAPVEVDACYEVALFGGDLRGQQVSRGDAELLGDRLATYRANCLVVVNAGAVKARFADRSPQQLAVLTRCINLGALVHGQQPYALVFVVDEPIPARTFNSYMHACQQLGTPVAMLQVQPDAIEALTAYVRFELERYATNHLEVRQHVELLDKPKPRLEIVDDPDEDAPLLDDDDIIEVLD